jgi:hypothetical protein
VCGLFSKSKFSILDSYINDFDIVCLCETKTDIIPDDEFPGFQPFCLQKKLTKHKFGGIHGLGILVKKEYSEFVTVVEGTVSKCVLWLHLNSEAFGTDIIIGGVYIPGENSVFHDADCYEDIEKDIVFLNANYADSGIVLLGDFNSRTGLCDDFVCLENEIISAGGLDGESYNNKDLLESIGVTTERFNLDTVSNNNGKCLIDLCRSFDLKVVNGRFGTDKGIGKFTCHTPNGRSVVDYAIVSTCLLSLISNFNVDVLDKCMSDVHSPISLSLSHIVDRTAHVGVHVVNDDAKFPQVQPVISKWKAELQCDYLNAFSQHDITKLENSIHSTCPADVTQTCIDVLFQDLCDIYINPAESVGLCKKVQNKGRPKGPNVRKFSKQTWFDSKCEVKRKEYLKCKNRLRCAKDESARLSCQVDLRKKSYEYKRFVNKCKNDYNKELGKNLRNLKTSNPKEYWNILNKHSNKSSTTGNIALESFMAHFKKLSQSDNIDQTDDFNPTGINHSVNENINKAFVLDEVVAVIKKLKCNKACGIDSIINEYLKNCPISVVNLVVNMFNLVLESGVVPTDWCIGIIQPLYKKKGSPNDPDNYRGITLLSCVGKLFTACLNERLATFLECAGILGEEQAGFRAGYSTLDHIFVLHSLIDLYISKERRMYCAFVDYKKAFDLVDRSYLWSKLIGSHINGNFLTVLYNMYKNAKSCVKKGAALSEIFTCNIGVRQGENLSPLLFSIFLNDFELFVSKSFNGMSMFNGVVNRVLSDDDLEYFIKMFVLLYADDTIVLAESEEELQKALNAVYEYCNIWKLTVNTSKTKVVVFSKGKIKRCPSFFLFGDEHVEVVDDYIYLGTTMNYNGRFNKAIHKQVVQAKRAMFSLLTKARRLDLPVDIQCELFEKMIVPILLYGSEVWGFSNIHETEVLYRNFLKNLLKLNRSTPSCIVYGEFGKSPLQNVVDKRMIQFWIKVSEGKSSKLSNIVYRLLYKLHNTGEFKSVWLDKVKTILDNCGLSDIWASQLTYDSKHFVKGLVSISLDDSKTQVWSSSFISNRRCDTYRVFKTDLCFEKYIWSLNYKERSDLAKFRCGYYKLPVYQNVSSNVVTCSLCSQVDVGDEFHYLFKCSALSQFRTLYLKKYYFLRPNTLKMHQLFNTTSKKQLSNLAKFVNVIMYRL